MQGFVWKSYTCHYHPGLFYVLTSNKQLFGVGADSCEGQNREPLPRMASVTRAGYATAL
jgi:hypothetical protein